MDTFDRHSQTILGRGWMDPFSSSLPQSRRRIRM
jgi:hypothetical protein